jgi:hypothetical protein
LKYIDGINDKIKFVQECIDQCDAKLNEEKEILRKKKIESFETIENNEKYYNLTCDSMKELRNLHHKYSIFQYDCRTIKEHLITKIKELQNISKKQESEINNLEDEIHQASLVKDVSVENFRLENSKLNNTEFQIKESENNSNILNKKSTALQKTKKILENELDSKILKRKQVAETEFEIDELKFLNEKNLKHKEEWSYILNNIEKELTVSQEAIHKQKAIVIEQQQLSDSMMEKLEVLY